jgi:hypothetical protein
VLTAAALLIAACGGDAGGEESDTAATSTTTAPDDTTGADSAASGTEPTPTSAPVDELAAEVLAVWQTEQPSVESLLVTDQLALVLERTGFDADLTAIDLTTGEMTTVAGTSRITHFVNTDTNGVFAFDFEECTFRSLDLDTLELGEGVGDLSSDGCTGGSDTSMVRADHIWLSQAGAVRVIDTSSGEVRSLTTPEISDRFAADDRSTAAFLDLGDAVLVTFFVSGEELLSLATRVEDDLTFGPLVEVPRRPYLENGVLVDDSTTDEGFTEIVVLDPVTLEVTDAERPPIAPFGTVWCETIDALRSHPAPDGSWWFGPVAVEGEVVMAQCRDGVEVARGVIEHDQFSSSWATADAFYYVATVWADPADDGTPSFDRVGEVLVRVGPQ